MRTTRYGETRGLHSAAQNYTFLARLGQDDREALKRTQALMRDMLGDTPSNPVMMSELLRVYLAQAA